MANARIGARILLASHALISNMAVHQWGFRALQGLPSLVICEQSRADGPRVHKANEDDEEEHVLFAVRCSVKKEFEEYAQQQERKSKYDIDPIWTSVPFIIQCAYTRVVYIFITLAHSTKERTKFHD